MTYSKGFNDGYRFARDTDIAKVASVKQAADINGTAAKFYVKMLSQRLRTLETSRSLLHKLYKQLGGDQ